jgi:hypothetical protein
MGFVMGASHQLNPRIIDFERINNTIKNGGFNA